MTDAPKDLITFLADEATDLVRQARLLRGADAQTLLDEAEELMQLRSRLLARADGTQRPQMELPLDTVAAAA